MYIKSYEVKNYRNLKDKKITPSKEINIICGENAQGKTNLIEGIYLFSGLKSFRGAKDSELVGFGKQKAKLNISFYSHSREQKAEIEIEQHRKLSLNGSNLKSPTEIAEQCHIIVFSPDLLSIIKEGPELRRRFLNNGISAMYPIYSENLKKYNRLLAQRNNLLKQIKKNPQYKELLEEYDIALAKFGAHIVTTRKRYISRLMQYLPKIFHDFTQSRENIDIDYICQDYNGSEEDLKNKLFESRENDILLGSTGIGPHRDDIEFLINGISAKSFGSQGQQRSVIIAVKLAEAEMLKEICGEQPIALLDDVMSELDEKRQDYILNHIKNWQVFITCCDHATIERLEKGKVFYVKDGKVTLKGKR